MDGPSLVLGIIGVGLSAAGAITAVAVYATGTRSDVDAAARKLRHLDDWKDHVVPATYARKDTMAAELTAIHASLQRIEKSQDTLVTRLMGGGL